MKFKAGDLVVLGPADRQISVFDDLPAPTLGREPRVVTIFTNLMIGMIVTPVSVDYVLLTVAGATGIVMAKQIRLLT